MSEYIAPIRDMQFVLKELAGLDEVAQLPGCEEATPDLVDAVLDEAARFCKDVLLPINASGDIEGCTWENGVVRTPSGFRSSMKPVISSTYRPAKGFSMTARMEPRLTGSSRAGPPS